MKANTKSLVLSALHRVVAKDLSEANRIIRELKREFFPDLRGPTVKIVNHTIPKWLGRAVAKWDNSKELSLVKMEIQKSILNDEETLRRVIAHELIHCWDYQETPYDVIHSHRWSGHGEFFLKEAARLNTKLGPDYVTPKSDETYVTVQEKAYYILIQPLGETKRFGTGKLGVSKFVRATPSLKSEVTKRIVRNKAHVFVTKDQDFVGAAQLKKYGNVSVYTPQEIKDKIKEIYEENDNVDDKFLTPILGLWPPMEKVSKEED